MDDLQPKSNTMKDGTPTKAIYIKNLALGDWESLRAIMAQMGGATVADAVRFAIRKTAGKI